MPERAGVVSPLHETERVDTPALDWLPKIATPTVSLPEQIAERVSRGIIAGTYTAGQRLSEQELAHYFRTSRGPIREALRLLEKDGLVELQPRRGAFVTRLTTKDVKDIFVIRASLFGIAARLAAERHDAGVIARLKESAERLRTLADRAAGAEEYVMATSRLSLFLADSAGNDRLAAMVYSLARQTLRYSRLGLSSRERRAQSARTWARLAKAIEVADRDAAERVANELVNNSRDTAIRLLEAGSRSTQGKRE